MVQIPPIYNTTNVTDINGAFEKIVKTATHGNEHFIRQYSGLVLEKVTLLDIHVGLYTLLHSRRARIAGGWTQLPKRLAAKRSVINVHNQDERCFGYALLSAIYPQPVHPERPSHYNFAFEEFGLDMLEYPVKLENLETIERYLGIGFNVYSQVDNEGISRYRLYKSKIEDPETAIDLYYWNNHFAWIKNFSAFFADVSKHDHHLYICKSCLCHFHNQQSKDDHVPICSQDDFANHIYLLPPPGSTLQFKNVQFMQKLPFVIYADFESVNSPQKMWPIR